MRDVHLHMSSGTDPLVLFELIRENGLKIKQKAYAEFEPTTKIKDVQNLDGYLKVLHEVLEKVQRSPIAVEKSTYSCFRSSYLAGTTELELRWSPYKRCNHFEIDMDWLIESSLSGMSKAHRIWGIKGTQAFCLGTDVPPEANEAVTKKALQYRKFGVTTLDVAGPVKTLQCIKNTGVDEHFMVARKAGLLLTIHAGEELREDTEEELAFVLGLGPDRIGHGVQIHRYPSLMRRAVAQGVELEICISSNIATRSVKSLEEFGKIFKTFEEYGVRYSINTDSTFALDTDIKKEYALYRKAKEL